MARNSLARTNNASVCWCFSECLFLHGVWIAIRVDQLTHFVNTQSFGCWFRLFLTLCRYMGNLCRFSISRIFSIHCGSRVIYWLAAALSHGLVCWHNNSEHVVLEMCAQLTSSKSSAVWFLYAPTQLLFLVCTPQTLRTPHEHRLIRRRGAARRCNVVYRHNIKARKKAINLRNFDDVLNVHAYASLYTSYFVVFWFACNVHVDVHLCFDFSIRRVWNE